MHDTTAHARDIFLTASVIPVGKLRRRDSESGQVPELKDLPPPRSCTDRRCRHLTLGGQEYCLVDLAAHFGHKPTTIRARLARGWSIHRSLTQPSDRNPPEYVLDFMGRTASIPEWARWLGISEGCLRARLRRMRLADALLPGKLFGGGRVYDFEGDRLLLRQWSDVKCIPIGALRKRLARGWSLERALSEPYHAMARRKR